MPLSCLRRARQLLEIKTDNNWFFNSNLHRRITASYCFHWDLETKFNKLLQKKRAAKISAEAARGFVTAKAIAAAQAETELMASQASGWTGDQPMRKLQLPLPYYIDKQAKTRICKGKRKYAERLVGWVLSRWGHSSFRCPITKTNKRHSSLS